MSLLQNKEELKIRWAKLQTALRNTEAEALLITDNVNLYYISGQVFNGICYMPVEGEPLFFVRRPVGLEDDSVVYIRKPEDLKTYFEEHNLTAPKKIMLESDSLSYNEYKRYQAIFGAEVVGNGTRLIREVRTIKTDFEIEQMKASGRLHTEVYGLIPSVYRPGMTETELSIEIERQFRLHGSLGIFRIFGQSMEIFMGSVIAGDNADNPSPYDFAMGGAGQNPSLPVGGNGTPLHPGISVMVDVGGNFNGYMTDMTRVFSIGPLTDLAYKAHDTSIEIQSRIMQTAKPGTEAKALFEIAADTAAEAGLSDYFMGHRQKAGFVGHGIGIEINESPVLAPRSRDILQENMIFALEPKFVIPEVGAVGIENSFVVTANGLEKITRAEEKIIELV